MAWVSNPLYQDGSTVQTAEMPICFCHVEVTDTQTLRQNSRSTSSVTDGNVEDHPSVLRAARAIAAASGIEALAGLGANAEEIMAGVVADSYHYQAAVFTLTLCVLAGILLSGASGRIMNSVYYTLAGMLWNTLAALLGFIAREPAEVIPNIFCNPVF